MFKKFVLTILFFVTCYLLMPSSSNSYFEWVKDSDQIKVLATNTMVGDLISQIGGSKVKVLLLVNGDIDPHSYELVKGDAEKFLLSDIVFANGLCLEHTFNVRRCLDMHKNVVYLGEYIKSIVPEKLIFTNGVVDPHVWMDINLWSLCIEHVADKLSEIDAKNKNYYASNKQKLSKEFYDLSMEVLDAINTIPVDRRYLVTAHSAFNYLVRGHFNVPDWEDRVIAIEGISPDQEINPLDINRVVEFVKKHRIPVIFSERTVSSNGLSKVVEISNKIGNTVHLSDEPLLGDTLLNKSYKDMVRYNVGIVVKHLRES